MKVTISTLAGVLFGLFLGVCVFTDFFAPDDEAILKVGAANHSGENYIGPAISNGKPIWHGNQVDELQIFSPKDYANTDSIIGYNSPIVNNRYRNELYPQTLVIPTGAPIYDLAYVAYSPDMAKRFYWPSDYIDDMPENLGLAHFRIQTVGSELSCTLGVLVKKDIGINTPPRPFAKHVHLSSMMGFSFPMPRQVGRGSLDIARNPDLDATTGYRGEDQQYFIEEGGSQGEEALFDYYLQNFFIYAGSKPPQETKLNGMIQTVGLNSYYPYYLPDYDYIEVNIGCIGDSHAILAPEFYLFAKKKTSATVDSTSVQYAPDQFVKLQIPQKFRERIGEVLPSVVSTYNSSIDARWDAIDGRGVEAFLNQKNNNSKR